MTALVRLPYTTELTGGLCVFPCFAVPRSIIRYLRIKRPIIVLNLEHELPVQQIPTQYSTYHRACPVFAILTGWCFKKHLFAGPPSTALGGVHGGQMRDFNRLVF
jgi:hypothetical protein